MGDGQRHVFRFFVDVVGEAGSSVELAAVDAAHARVLRLADGDSIELVDGAGVTWDARLEGSCARLVVRVRTATGPPPIELVAGALVGGKFDELVDAAVQAGASLITPLVTTSKDAERLRSRRARLERIARAAAKQAKRDMVPVVDEPTTSDLLPAWGIVVDPTAPRQLDEVVAGHQMAPIRLLVGAAEGFPPGLVEQLVERGWERGRLGPTILRAELAAPVAVAIAAMHAPHLTT